MGRVQIHLDHPVMTRFTPWIQSSSSYKRLLTAAELPGLPSRSTTERVFFFSSQLKMGSTSPIKIILGSSSVARRNILNAMGYTFNVVTADIDEKSIRKENPEELVMALAEAKADAIVPKIDGIPEHDSSQSFLITADTVVVFEGMIREKPHDEEEARRFITGYSGRRAETVGSVMITDLSTGFRKGKCDRVEIYFHEIPDEIVNDLIEEGAVLNVAGGLIIEHPKILPFVKEVVGSIDSVMGLPKAITEELLRESLEHQLVSPA